jgi:hypothetical protein
MEALEGVRWGWVVTYGFFLGCLFRFVHWRLKLPTGPSSLFGAILLGAVLAVLPLLFHASRETTEFCAAMSLAMVIGAILGLLWRRRVPRPSSAAGQEQHGS